jgi:hypothetical protein
MVQSCPHNDLPPWYVLNIFYGGFDQNNKRELDFLSGGSFVDRTLEQDWINQKLQ